VPGAALARSWGGLCGGGHTGFAAFAAVARSITMMVPVRSSVLSMQFGVHLWTKSSLSSVHAKRAGPFRPHNQTNGKRKKKEVLQPKRVSLPGCPVGLTLACTSASADTPSRTQAAAAILAVLPGFVAGLAGAAGGEFGIRGFVEATDLNTGKALWRTYTIPGGGQRSSPNAPTADRAWAGDVACCGVNRHRDAPAPRPAGAVLRECRCGPRTVSLAKRSGDPAG
jgi:hypothetical protein